MLPKKPGMMNGCFGFNRVNKIVVIRFYVTLSVLFSLSMVFLWKDLTRKLHRR